jgi:hypothetical protein
VVDAVSPTIPQAPATSAGVWIPTGRPCGTRHIVKHDVGAPFLSWFTMLPDAKLTSQTLLCSIPEKAAFAFTATCEKLRGEAGGAVQNPSTALTIGEFIIICMASTDDICREIGKVVLEQCMTHMKAQLGQIGARTPFSSSCLFNV